MIVVVIRFGLLTLFVALLVGCGSVPEVGWETDLERRMVGRSEFFAGGERVLTGRADIESEGTLRKGDESLFGVCLDVHGHKQVWYLHLRVLEVKVQRSFMARRTQPYESRLLGGSVGRKRETSWAKLPVGPTVVRPGSRPRVAQMFGSLDHLMSDVPVARIQAEVFDADGHSLGASASHIAVPRLVTGLHAPAVAGFAQRDLMRGRVALGKAAEIIRLADLTEDARRDLQTVGAGRSALWSFFAVLKRNPVTRDLLFKVVALPSLWSMIKTFRIRASMSVDFFDARPVAGERFPDAGGDLWSFPLTLLLNKQPALIARVVVGPRGVPNAIAAGIYAIEGRHPGDPGRRIQLQLIATRRGPAVEN